MTTEQTVVTEKVTIAQKMAALESEKTALRTAIETADESAKAGLTAQIQVIDRKLRWYQGRQDKPARQPRQARAPRTPKTKATKAEKPTEEAPADPTGIES